MTLISRLITRIAGRPDTPVLKLESRLGYTFKDRSLLEQALTHRSITDISHRNYERLEFLGDAVLNMVISSGLYQRCKSDSEGDLTLKRSSLVNKTFLAYIGENMGVHHHVLVQGGVRMNDKKVRRNLVGDVMEALIGAIYRDGGLAEAEKFIVRKILRRRKEANLINYKGQLIELCHQLDLAMPRFILIKTRGPEHDKKFVVQVKIASRKFKPAQANNKKAAEQEAAQLALTELLEWKKVVDPA